MLTTDKWELPIFEDTDLSKLLPALNLISTGVESVLTETYDTLPEEFITNGITVTPPAGAKIQHFYHRCTDSTSGSGIVAHTFPVPFPTGIAHIFFSTVSGSAFAPVLNGGSVSRTGFNVVFPNNLNTAVVFSYHAVGW